MRWVVRLASRLLGTAWKYVLAHGYAGLDAFADYESLFD